MAHTKGKWFYNKRNSTLFEIRNQDEKLIAELESYERNKQIMGFDELESNAKIIASAPELLEALNILVEWYAKRGNSSDKMIHEEIILPIEKQNGEIQKAMLVIKKATE